MINMIQTKKSSALTASRVRMALPEKGLSHAVIPIFSAVLMLSGIWLVIFEVLDDITVPLAAIIAAAAAGLAAAALYRPVRIWRIVALVFFVVAAITVLIFWKQFNMGAVSCMAKLSALLTKKTGYLYFEYDGSGDPTLFLTLLSLFLGLLCGALHRLKSPIFAVAGILIFGLPCVFGLLEPGLWLACGLSGCFLILALRAADGRVHPAAVLPMLLAAAIAGAVLISVPEPMAGISGSVKSFIHALRFEKSENPLPEGRLRNLGPYRPQAEPALTVTMDQWTPLYLRGFVGERYTEDGWEPLKGETVAGDAAMLYNLQKSYFYPVAQLSAASAETGEEAVNHIRVTPAGACRAYQYLPYGISAFDGLDARALSGAGTIPDRAYETALYPVADAYLTQAELAEMSGDNSDYLDGEAAYRAFVYENDTAIPDTVYAQLSEHFPVGDTSMTTTEAKLTIQDWLDTAMTYDDDAINGSGDFLRYLLEFDGRGYSVHYAAVTTLLMRTFGIPARYVEGYVVTSEEADALEDGETLTLTQQNSHAWTEYYLDGVGWLPFDTTPGYTRGIVYRLPEDGMGNAGDDSHIHSGLVEALPKRNLQIDTSGAIGEDSGPVYVFEVLIAVALFALLLLLALIVKAVLLRRRLRRRVRGFETLPPAQGSADCLRYMMTVLRLCGIPQENIPLTRRVDDIAGTMDLENREDARKIAWLATEVWYSDHEISEEQRGLALSCLTYALDAWRRRSNFFKRFKDRWIACKIL